MLNLHKLKIRTQLIILLSAVIALFLASTLVSWLALNRAKTEFTSFIEHDQRILLNYTELYANGLQTGQALRNIVLDPANAKAYENFDKASGAIDKLMGETRDLLGSGGPQAEALAKVAQLRETLKAQQLEIRDLVNRGDHPFGQGTVPRQPPDLRQHRASGQSRFGHRARDRPIRPGRAGNAPACRPTARYGGSLPELVRHAERMVPRAIMRPIPTLSAQP